VMACALFLHTTIAAAQDRSNHPNRPAQEGAATSRAQQALDSRRTLLDRAAPQTSSSAARNAVQQSRTPLTLPETAKGRLGQERSASRMDNFRGRQARETASRRSPNGRPSFSDDIQGRRPADGREIRQSAGTLNETRRQDVVNASQNRMSTSDADRHLAKRLADIDHMRDVAIENGNERQLQQADQLEQLARQQYEQRTTDEKLRANEVFSPDRGESRGVAPNPPREIASGNSTARERSANKPPQTESKHRQFFSLDRFKRMFEIRQNNNTRFPFHFGKLYTRNNPMTK